MITVPQEWQLPQIAQCCPGIGPLGEGVQKVVKGMEAESEKPRQRVSNADRKVFANPESFCNKFIIG